MTAQRQFSKLPLKNSQIYRNQQTSYDGSPGILSQSTEKIRSSFAKDGDDDPDGKKSLRTSQNAAQGRPLVAQIIQHQ